MEPTRIICILLILTCQGLAADIIFFADDHYKSISQLQFNASVTNPANVPGEATLRISLANQGRVEELIPISSSGPPDDILLELKEEMNSSDAMDIRAVLDDTGPFLITSGPQHIAILPAGEAEELQFEVTIDKRADGWYYLPLRVDYVRQVDVSVSDGEVFPLRQSLNQTLRLRVYVTGYKDALRICVVESDLSPGRSGLLRLVVENAGEDELRNCSTSLLAAPPFHFAGPDLSLGDLAPGDMALASFQVYVDENAGLAEYQLGCRIRSEEMNVVVPFTLKLKESDSSSWHPAAPLVALLAILLLGVFALLRQKLLYRRKRRTKRH